jgi:hypothetical protein
MNVIINFIDGWVIRGSIAGTIQDFQVDPNNCKVTINGKPAKYGDLRAGDLVEISGRPATSIAATRSEVALAAEEGAAGLKEPEASHHASHSSHTTHRKGR